MVCRAFNFGIPSLPWVNGRDLAGIVVEADASARVKQGDLVLVPSTDYRDIRKAAFQEYAVATHFNAARIPSTGCVHASASLGVAFVASVLALGVSLGLDLSRASPYPGPNLVEVVHWIDRDKIPLDIQGECFKSADEAERPQKGDWIAIWGGECSTIAVFKDPTDQPSLYHDGVHHAPTSTYGRSQSHLRRGHCAPRSETD